MRRRSLLSTAALAATGSAFAATEASASIIGEIAFGGAPDAEPVPLSTLGSRVGVVESDLWGARFHQLRNRLSGVLGAAEATVAHASPDDAERVSRLACRAWNVAAYYLTKMHDNGLAGVAAERADRYAQKSSDPVLAAESARLTATVLRRGPHYAAAGPLVLTAADDIKTHGDLTRPEDASAYARMLASAAYTAALRDDRDGAWALLGEAVDAFTASGTTGTAVFNATDVTVFHSSIARVLGDYGSAVHYIGQVQPGQITTPERRARYWQDTALALYGRGRVDDAVTALLRAEADTPQEVRYRPWARQLIAELTRARPRDTALAELTTRIGVTPDHGLT